MDRPPLWTDSVAVIMPCHNAERTLREAVESVMAQTFPGWELVIVDDGSSDGSTAMLRGFAAADPRVRIIRNDKPSGASSARNTALAATRARYVAFLDSDDAWLPMKLEVELGAMREYGAALVCGAYDVMDADGTVIGEVRPKPGVLSYRGILGNNPIGTLTTMLDRTLCGDVRFNTELRTSEDYFLWLTILKGGLIAVVLPDVMGRYRVHGKSLSSNKLFAARNRWRVYREFEKHNLVASVFYLALYAITGVVKSALMRRRRIAGPG